MQQIFLGADVALKRHDDFFANGVDGRVGDLGKALFEVVVEHAGAIGHHRKGRVVTHGTQRISQLGYHWAQHKLHGFLGETKGVHAFQQRCLVEPFAADFGQFVEGELLFF